MISPFKGRGRTSITPLFLYKKNEPRKTTSDDRYDAAIDSYDEMYPTFARNKQPLAQIAGSSAGGLPQELQRLRKLVDSEV